MVIDAILQPGIAFGVRARLALEGDRAAVRKDHSVPDEQHTPLAEADAAIILPDDAGALGYEQNLACGAVIDVFRHLRGDLSRKIGADAGDERGGNYRSGLKDIARGGR